MPDRKINSGDMFESLMCFINERLPDGGMVCPNSPDIFILVAANSKGDLTFSSTSNSHKKTLDTLKRAIYLHEGDVAKLEVV